MAPGKSQQDSSREVWLCPFPVMLHSTQMMLKRPSCSPMASVTAWRSSHHHDGTPHLLDLGSAAFMAGEGRREVD